MKLDDIKDIAKAIIDLMAEHELTEFEMEKDGVRISIKKGAAPVIQTAPGFSSVEQNPVQAETATAAEAAVDETRFQEIKAPFVGTFYRAPTPESEQFVAVGQEVEPDTVLCIIEAMKVMNEIKAETTGIVREILVENAHAVQFGEPLFKIEKV